MTLRVAGAPRGSWGGRTAAFAPPSFASSDSALVMMLKQAKALFLDRVALATRRDSICEHPPLFDARVRNAYLVVSPRYACAMLLPGMLVPPFADERYDEESLYARIGFVIAHEFGHISSITQYWNVEAVARMLVRDYASSMWPEALADRIGVWAVVQTGRVRPARLCAHVSQLWCARIGALADRTAEGRSHPLSNERGDALCAYLKRYNDNSQTQPPRSPPPPSPVLATLRCFFFLPPSSSDDDDDDEPPPSCFLRFVFLSFFFFLSFPDEPFFAQLPSA